jgi:hypothetical protein
MSAPASVAASASATFVTPHIFTCVFIYDLRFTIYDGFRFEQPA